MSDDVRAEPIEAPQLRTLYRFWAPESLHSADREWVGWFDQRHWYAAFGDGMWDVRYVSRWEPLLAPLRELADSAERDAPRDVRISDMKPSGYISVGRAALAGQLTALLDQIEGKP